MFEGNRLAVENLMAAYRQVLPVRHHAAKVNKILAKETETNGTVSAQEVRL